MPIHDSRGGRLRCRRCTTRPANAMPVASASSPTRRARRQGDRRPRARGAPPRPTPRRPRRRPEDRRRRGPPPADPARPPPQARCGLAMVFLRDEAARYEIEAGLQGRRPRAARVARRAGRARRPRRGGARERAEDRAARLRSPARAEPRGGRAARLPRPQARGADRRARTSARSPSARSPTRRSAPPTSSAPSTPTSRDPAVVASVRDLPPALLDQHDAVLGARAAVPPPLPQRRDQRDPGQRQLDARAGGRLGSPDDALLAPVLDESGSDSAMLDNALELLVRHGRDVRHAAAMLVPEAWEGNPELDEDVRDFYRYHACLVEPWDGPAGLVFTDGRVVGAALDRNGLRPLRFAVGSDGLVVCSSEAGAVDVVDGRRVRRGKLGPGQMIAVDPRRRRRDRTRRSSAGSPSRRPYGRWLAALPRAGRRRRARSTRPWRRPDAAPGRVRLHARGARGAPPPGGRNAATSRPRRWATTRRSPPLAGRARPLYPYFKQRFAQVTNPPIDHLRERFVMSLRTLLGARAPLLAGSPEAAAASSSRASSSSRLRSPALGLAPLDATFAEEESLEAACDAAGASEAEAAVRAGAGLLLVSDAALGAGARADAGRCSPSARCTTALVGARPADAGVAPRRERRAARGAPLRLPARLRRRGDLPAARARDARRAGAADRLGGDRPSPAEAQRASGTRSRTAC